uniref:hypothetical protein n=1 Tax=Chamaesiphon sp. GL140_3_metabinner_50 TaxID=2970812 RepID=UPI0025F8E3FC
MNTFLTKISLASAIVLSGIYFSAGNANAVLISGTGNPLTAIPGATVIDFETTTSGDFSSVTIGNVTFSGIGAPLTIGSDFSGQFNNPGKSISNGFDFVP